MSCFVSWGNSSLMWQKSTVQLSYSHGTFDQIIISLLSRAVCVCFKCEWSHPVCSLQQRDGTGHDIHTCIVQASLESNPRENSVTCIQYTPPHTHINTPQTPWNHSIYTRTYTHKDHADTWKPPYIYLHDLGILQHMHKLQSNTHTHIFCASDPHPLLRVDESDFVNQVQ